MEFADYLNTISGGNITFVRNYELETYKAWIQYVPEWWSIEELLLLPADCLSIADLQKVLRYKQDKQLISSDFDINCYRNSISIEELVEMKMSLEDKKFVTEEMHRLLNTDFDTFKKAIAELKENQINNPNRVSLYLLYMLDDIDFEISREKLEEKLAILREKNLIVLRRSANGVF